jgi:hypothetical protein
MYRASALILLMVAAAAAGAGCAAPIEAKPAEVTYYYLPG